MTTATLRHLARLALALAAAVLLGLAMLSPVAHAGDSVRVITSPDRAGVAIERSLLRSLFSMRTRQWPDGTPVRVFVLPDNSEVHARFCREQLGTYPYVLRGVWDRLVFTGTGFAPITVSSEAEMRQRVDSTPGAIGYLSSDASVAGPRGQQR